MFGDDATIGALGMLIIGFIALFFAVILGAIIFAMVKGTGQWNRNNKSPVETWPAKVVAKRSKTSGGGHDTSASAFYYVTFEFPDGRREELAVSPSDFGQLVEGDNGQLTRQGTRFKGFQRQYVTG